MSFSEEFSNLEGIAIRKMFLQLKFDILSENNSELTTYAEKRIKKDLERQLEAFNNFYDNFIRRKNYSTKQKAKATQIIFKECLQKFLKYYSSLKLIWEESEIQLIKKKLWNLLLFLYFVLQELRKD